MSVRIDPSALRLAAVAAIALLCGGTEAIAQNAGLRGSATSPVTDRIIAELRAGANTSGQDGQTDAPALYSGALAFVFPSLYEGFGLPPLEAMSAACPVLCANTSSLPEVVGDAAITFDPGDVDAIREAMQRVAQSPDLRRDLIARGHQRRKLFTWDRCVSETLDVYRKLG